MTFNKLKKPGARRHCIRKPVQRSNEKGARRHCIGKSVQR
jgi:hypothetical protein